MNCYILLHVDLFFKQSATRKELFEEFSTSSRLILEDGVIWNRLKDDGF